MTIIEYVKSEALRQAGIPVLASELQDDKFTEYIINPSLYDYYITAPYEFSKQFSFSEAGTLRVDIPDLTVEKTDWPPTLNHEFVGLTGFQFAPGISTTGAGTSQIIQDMIDDLTGENIDSQFIAITQSQLRSTVQDLTLPDELVNYDTVLKKLHVYAPGPGKMGIIFGYYLDDVSYVKPSHRIAFSKIVVKKFLELLISARSSVIISSDITMDISAMQQKLDLINEAYLDDMTAIATPVITWG